ncbi:heparinase [Niabella ginsenosidivorans]|uniref:Heparinase n=2 Tax=Niabella ginsenosidivorans TaxID=1176587 RepID=A0A1A9I8R5_9BACT|nr:heparinase [Niabella ginsenosidivorans]
MLLQAGITTNLFSQTDSIAVTAAIGNHPRILLLEHEEENIRNTIAADPVWQRMHEAILSECDKIVAEPPVERIKIGRRLLDKSREALRRLFFLSYGYRMTQQKKYLDRAEKEMLAIAAFSDWNPSHFLDVAEMTMAVSIGYDWLYQELPAGSKAVIKAAIIEKGLSPSLDPKNNSWLRAEHNWNQVCNAGMTYGAMAVYEDAPALCRSIINRAIKTIVKPMQEYAPDGAYPEGYGYWGYGTSFNVLFLHAVKKCFGSDFGLSNSPGFLRTASFLENMTGPTGKPFNFSDAGEGGSGLQPAMFWFAAALHDPSVLWVERGRLLENNFSAFMNDRLLPGIMLWNNGIKINSITAPKELIWVGRGRTPVALMRTSWTDTSAIFVGMKGGSASVNHAHMDIGSFVMDAQGVRWAMDFGAQDYESLESKGLQIFGRTQDAQRWTVFRYINQVHNTLTVNDRQQLVKGYAPITGHSSDPSFLNATADLSEIYKGTLVKALRGVAIVGKKYVVVRDEMETAAAPVTIRWTMLTPAEAKITNDHTITLTQKGRTLLLDVTASGKVVMKTWSTTPPHGYDAPNPGTVLVGFELTVPAHTKAFTAVRLIPGKSAGQMVVPSLNKWPAGK